MCDVCKTNIIMYKWCYIPLLRNFLNDGTIYFKCNNGHHFFVHTRNHSYETICKRFNQDLHQ